MQLKRLIKEPWPRIIGIPIVSFLIVLISHPDEITILKYLVTLTFVSVMWNGDCFIILGFRKRWPLLRDTHKRIIATALAVCAFNISADLVICSGMEFIGVPGFGGPEEGFVDNLSKNLITTFIIGTLYETGYFFEKWRHQTIEMEKVRSQQLRSELSVLKNQISPHFLFNSLNTLVTLIHENQVQAAQFTEKLSEVYRYILQHKDKEIVKLETELEFVNAYNFLMKMRFEDSLHLKIRVSKEEKEKFIVPLSIQMLVENAVKHNVVSQSKPLEVEIFVDSGQKLIVRNNLQKKLQGVNSMKTGLKNIERQYHYLSQREVDIFETKSHFTVVLPLIELSPEIEHLSA